MAAVSNPKYQFNLPSASSIESSQSQAKTKFCGYLKKKRNKMGGWRKMWFVLQDKLLLSYGSKEEYDNKLVSFKDVLNLVPGTIVRPLGGFRFTIETTSQAMYTFHCDDRVAYRKWIKMLLYSLTTDSISIVDHEKSLSLVKQFSSISLDSYTSQDVKQVQNPETAINSNCEYITAGAAVLPIDIKTAKILERSSIDAVTDSKLVKTTQHSVQHFRLHNFIPNKRSVSATELGNLRHITLLHVPEKSYTVSLINRMFHAENQTKSIPKQGDETKKSEFEEGARSVNVPGDNALSNENFKRIRDQESKTLDMIKEKIHHITVKGSKNSTIDTTISDSIEKHTEKTLSIKAKIQEVIMKKDFQPVQSNDKTDGDIRQCDIMTEVRVEPVYACVDFKSKYENRKMRHPNLDVSRRSNSYDSIIQQTYDQFPIQKDIHWNYESSSKVQKPIRPLRSESCIYNEIARDEVDGIYEDGDVLENDNLTGVHSRYLEENIYEPINITSQPHNSIWNYFNRLKLNAILQMKRSGKKKSTDYKYSKPSKPSLCEVPAFDIKNKNSANRKSIKVRMRKFCFRGYEPKPFFKHQQQNIFNSQIPTRITPIKKLKNGWKSVKLAASQSQSVLRETEVKDEKRFFGSLPHIRKGRISLFSNQHFQRSQESDATLTKRRADALSTNFD